MEFPNNGDISPNLIEVQGLEVNLELALGHEAVNQSVAQLSSVSTETENKSATSQLAQELLANYRDNVPLSVLVSVTAAKFPGSRIYDLRNKLIRGFELSRNYPGMITFVRGNETRKDEWYVNVPELRNLTGDLFGGIGINTTETFGKKSIAKMKAFIEEWEKAKFRLSQSPS